MWPRIIVTHFSECPPPPCLLFSKQIQSKLSGTLWNYYNHRLSTATINSKWLFICCTLCEVHNRLFWMTTKCQAKQFDSKMIVSLLYSTWTPLLNITWTHVKYCSIKLQNNYDHQWACKRVIDLTIIVCLSVDSIQLECYKIIVDLPGGSGKVLNFRQYVPTTGVS